MSIGVGSLVANLTANTSGYVSGMAKATRANSDFSKSMRTTSQVANNPRFSVDAMAAAIGGGAFGAANNLIGQMVNGVKSLASSFYGLVASSVSAAAQLEQNTVAFTTLLGSADAAREHLQALRDFSATTPFEFPELVSASRRLMALGFAADQVVPILRIVGDAAGSLGLGAEGVDRITLALGQIRSKGKLSAQEVNQLAEAGIPAWEAVAKAIGVDIPTAMKMAENGAISSGVAINAILDSMQNRFAGGMEKQSKTMLGRWSNLKDQVGFILTDLGTAIAKAFGFTDALSGMEQMLAAFRSRFLPAIQSGIQYLGATWQNFLMWLNGAWNSGLGNIIQNAAVLATNWGLTMSLIEQYTLLAFDNIGRMAANLVTQVIEASHAAVQGMKAGLGLGAAAPTPDMGRMPLQTSNPVIRALLQAMEAQQFAMFGGGPAQVKPFEPEPLKPLEDMFRDNNNRKENNRTTTGAVVAGSREALSIIAQATNSARNQQLMEQKKQTEEQKKTNSILEDMADDVVGALQFEVASI